MSLNETIAKNKNTLRKDKLKERINSLEITITSKDVEIEQLKDQINQNEKSGVEKFLDFKRLFSAIAKETSDPNTSDPDGIRLNQQDSQEA